ncbi:TniQ family protein [Endozoicomonas acroporae]|uniref:TniQ family protein n=1 Tax=Endozoicomonas acroporae TaxID=1701104 RepID=UPI0013D6A7BA|nr:TniQ family protein [Endozoicomonas acroporae]
MLRYFPVAYDDELLYSQIARYNRHSCSPGWKQTLSELFGSRTVAAVVDLPAHLGQLQEHTGHITRQSAHDTLWRQTLFPVYAPFLGPDLTDRVKQSMLSGYGGDIHTRAGLSASSVKRPDRLKVCPECLNEQLQKNGEAYWQRLFQVTGVLFALYTTASSELLLCLMFQPISTTTQQRLHPS